MWTENKIFLEDLQNICNAKFIPWENLCNKTIFVTGATGLIGKTFISAILYYFMMSDSLCRIIALVRDVAKAKEIFAGQLRDSTNLLFMQGDIENIPEFEENVDYIVHGASPTASKYFAEKPVETIRTAAIGTLNVLELAKRKKIKGMVYLSSMEVYGAPMDGKLLDESDVSYMDPLLVRNCYPESKRLCENACVSYNAEYNLPVMMARLSQTFGPGISENDNRVFAQFSKCARDKKDIILQTTGESKRTYVYTMDAVSAVLTILLRGKHGQCYNVSNIDTYCSIYEMAVLVAEKIANSTISVKVEVNSMAKKTFPPVHMYNLNSNKLQQLGWTSTTSLVDMYHRMMKGYTHEACC